MRIVLLAQLGLLLGAGAGRADAALVFIGATSDGMFRALDLWTGAVLW